MLRATFLFVCGPRQSVDVYVRSMAARQVAMATLSVVAQTGSGCELRTLMAACQPLFFVFVTEQDWTLLAF
jgi:hypothetical protein